MDMIDDQLAERIKDLNWPPLMEWRQFAEWVRVEQGAVEGWVKRAYIPTVKIGRHRMVNIVRLLEQMESGRSEHGAGAAPTEASTDQGGL